MKSKLCFTLFAAVVTFDTGVSAQMASVNASTPSIACYISAGKDQAAIERCNQIAQKEVCRDIELAYTTALTKAQSACKAAGKEVAECKDAAEECADQDDQEMDGSGTLMNALGSAAGSAFGVQVPSFGSLSAGEYKKSCLSRRDYKEEKKGLNTDLKDAEKEISRIQKDITKAQKDAEEKKRKIEQELQEMNAAARKEDLEENKSQRSEAEQTQRSQTEAKVSIRRIQADIIRAQGTLAKAIAERTQTLARLSDALISADCQAKLDEVIAKTKSLRTGSASGLITRNALRKGDLKNRMALCIRSAQTERQAGREQANAAVEAIQSEIAAKEDELKGLRQSVNLAAENQQTQKLEQAQSKQQQQQERMMKMQSKSTEYQTVTTALQQEIQQFNMDLQKANERKNKLSNEMALLGTAPSGDKSTYDAVGAASEADAIAKQRCAPNNCNCGQEMNGKPSTPSTGTPAISN